MNGAQLVIKALVQQGVSTCFGYPGGAIMPIYDAFYQSEIKHILVRNEQGAALAALGYARASGEVGVCLATSGPGATNLITGLADAYLDSIPVVAITGQVASPLIGTDAFQEVDVLGLSLPITKHSFLVEDIAELGDVLQQAFALAKSGRPGPVLVDIPKDIQLAAAELPPLLVSDDALPAATADQLALARQLLSQAERPVLYVGGGVGMAKAVPELRAFLEQTQIPAVTTLKGIGTLPKDHPRFLGMLGMHGNQAANLAVQSSDLLIAIGARFDDRVTGKLDTFAPDAKVIHFDIDEVEFGKLRRPHALLHGDMKPALAALAMTLSIDEWRRQCDQLKTQYAWRYDAPGEGIYAPALLRQLSDQLPDDAVVSCDVGQHQMWVAQHMQFDSPHDHLSSGGLGTMGFGMPAAVGAQLARPDATVVNVTGDGSIMMNIQELGTIKRFNLPVKIVLIDNERLGMVRQWQELFFDKRYSETNLSDNPDFLTLASAFDIPGQLITQREQIPAALDAMLSATGPYLLHVAIDAEENVWPLVPPGAANQQMMEKQS
ncbi:acetolactate synthase 2 catalytic subunit [Corallincola spongiicola]|uniref:Acetolactate synthase n=1 Tax=Corallincola spongiicola TaxID=2520508 RepID=A0ABY1WL15_9GAMM|nr:acetolactate synthase 2 catalytic subunit [Corallincola spongiicola]TAA41026.1 acetolactate synthase 2 catalytic subunit [Corallincola spongiicola]